LAGYTQKHLVTTLIKLKAMILKIFELCLWIIKKESDLSKENKFTMFLRMVPPNTEVFYLHNQIKPMQEKQGSTIGGL